MKTKWIDEGYEIFHENKNNGFYIYAVDKNGAVVAEVTFFELSTGEIVAGGGKEEYEPFVKPKHRRKGLMSAMYLRAERITGKKAAPTSDLSAAGEMFWNQKSRGFGK